MSERIQVTLPCRGGFLHMALAATREAAHLFGFAGSPVQQLEVAVEEAVTNVFKHAYDPEENPTFDLIFEPLPGGMQVIVKEMGIPFDAGRIPTYTPGSDVEEASARGVGVFLMRAMVDECSFVNLGPGGKETRLVKYLEGGKPEEAPRAPEVEQPEVIKEKVEYEVRQMAEHEAIEVSRCAYKSHGYSFFDDHIYYPERLVELNRSGDMLSAVAVTSDGVFMGHTALLFQYPEDRIAELTFAFVNLEYRGQGALHRLTDFLFSTPTKRPLDGVYAYAVANHVFTQKTMGRFGINDCAILLATSPASWKFKGIPGDPDQRISVVLAFKYTRPPEPVTIYPPPHHAEMIRKLYASIGGVATLAAPPPDLAPGVGGSVIHVGVNESESCAEIFVASYGADPVREVRKRLRTYCLAKIEAINLFLDLGNPATAALTAEFEKLGFFFGGVLPRARIGETLILQYLNNVDLHYDKIQLHSEIAKEILAYIRAHDPNETT